MQDLTELSIKDRIRKVLIYLTPKQKEEGKEKIPNKFAKRVGIAQKALSNWLNKKSLPSLEGLYKLYIIYPYINYDWVVTGRGNMLSNNENANKLIFDTVIPSKGDDSLLVELLRDELVVKNNTINSISKSLEKNMTILQKVIMQLEQSEKEKEQLREDKKQLNIKLTKAAKALGDKLNDMQAD